MTGLFKEGDEVGSMWGDGNLRKCKDGYGIQCDATAVLWINGCPMGVFFLDTGIKQTDRTNYPQIWHKETGSAPIVGERPFEYPIYKRGIMYGQIVEFTGLKKGVCVKQGQYNNLGESSSNWVKHTDDNTWEDCEPPEAKELTVADIEKALGYKVKIVK